MTQEQALTILKTGANVFLTGEPGSGKTHTINTYVRWLKSHGIEPAITASTGIAATHIGGMTIHSFAGIGIADFLSKYDLERIASTERIARRILATQVLIIDEVSMLDAGKLQMVEAICRAVRSSELPFGGLQMVVVGDFFQLPPIATAGKMAIYAFQSPTWQALNPIVCYLTEQHRQDDPVYLDVLSAIRRNTFGQPHHQSILSRRIELSQSPPEIPKLFSHNVDVDRINSSELAKLSGSAKTWKMQAKGRKALVEQLRRGCLSPESLDLKKNAVVMFTKNSTQGKFVNGTLGVVVGFDQDSGLPVVKLRTGPKLTVGPVKWSLEDHGTIKAFIEQLPLRLAWAITVHKSQGMSMDAAVMDLSDTFEFGQGYVALSRVRRLSGLHLLGINAKAWQVHPLILEKDEEFRAASSQAAEKFASLTAELPAWHEKFIRACGGKVEEIEIEPASVRIGAGQRDNSKRWEDTLELIGSGKSIAEAATLRSRTAGTIFKHLEELRKLGKVDRGQLAHLSVGKEQVINEINQAQKTLGAAKLTPVFEHFKGRHSYDDIRLARLLL